MLMMYLCKQCGQFSLLGCINEYKEHFCNIKCYENYCRQHNYEFHPEKLKGLNSEQFNELRGINNE